MSFYLTYDGETNEDYGLLIYQRPNYRIPEERVETYDIAGRESRLTQRNGRFENFEIDVTLNYMTTPETWGETFRRAVCWLRRGGRLSFSDDPDAFYNVIYVTIEENERTAKRIGKFTVTFVCSPGTYYLSGTDYLSVSEVLTNPYSMCRPIYRILANGAATLTVNGNEMTMYSYTGLYIDTDLKIAYTLDGETANTTVTGDYDDLVLVTGENTISLSNGSLTVRPNWRVL